MSAMQYNIVVYYNVELVGNDVLGEKIKQTMNENTNVYINPAPCPGDSPQAYLFLDFLAYPGLETTQRNSVNVVRQRDDRERCRINSGLDFKGPGE